MKFDKIPSIAHLMDLGYILMQLDGKIVDGNTAIKNMLGYPKVKGLNFFKQWAISSDSDNFVNSVISNKIVRNIHTEIKHQDNSISFLSINAQLLQQEGHTFIECVISLCSERNQSQFDKTCQNMSRSLSQLIEKQIASVVGTADMLRLELMGGGLNPKSREIAHHAIQENGNVRQRSDYLAAKEQSSYHHVCLHQLSLKLTQTYQSSIFSANPRKISYHLNNESYNLLGDDKKVAQVLLHLIDNAIEATDKHGEIVVSNRTVEIKNNNINTTYLMLTVEDNGHGIDKETQQRIFKPFFTTRSKKRGMSLTHVKKTVKIFQGRIKIKSIVGKGTVMKVLLPIVVPATPHYPTDRTIELLLKN